jgi:hypothetical protein
MAGPARVPPSGVSASARRPAPEERGRPAVELRRTLRPIIVAVSLTARHALSVAVVTGPFLPARG